MGLHHNSNYSGYKLLSLEIAKEIVLVASYIGESTNVHCSIKYFTKYDCACLMYLYR